MPNKSEQPHDKTAQRDDDDWGVPAGSFKMSEVEAAKMASEMPGFSNMLKLTQVMLILAIVIGFFGYSSGHSLIKEFQAKGFSLEEVVAASDISSVKKPEVNSKTDAPSLNEDDASAGAASDVPTLDDDTLPSDVPSLDDDGHMNTNTSRVASLFKLQLKELSGPLISLGDIGCGLWYALSSIVGSLCVMVPLFVYNLKAKRTNANETAGSVFLDVLLSSATKYVIMGLMLFVSFKYTDLISSMLLTSLAIIMIYDVVQKTKTALKTSAEAIKKMNETKKAAEDKEREANKEQSNAQSALDSDAATKSFASNHDVKDADIVVDEKEHIKDSNDDATKENKNS